MKKQEAITLFHSMHPGFFEQEDILSLSEDWTFDEMMLRLSEFEPNRYEKELDADRHDLPVWHSSCSYHGAGAAAKGSPAANE